MFSAMALVGIAVIAPKFDRRQRQVEGRFLGRQEAAIERQRRAAGLPAIDLADSAREPDAQPRERIVPLWTLASLAAAAALCSAAMLARERKKVSGLFSQRPEDGQSRLAVPPGKES